MANFSYDRINGTPQKQNQAALVKLNNYIERKLLAKTLDFINRI